MNRKVATFFYAVGLCAATRSSYAWREPVAVSDGPGKLTLYAAGDNNWGLSKKEYANSSWSAWASVYSGQVAKFAVANVAGTSDFVVVTNSSGRPFSNWFDVLPPFPPFPPCPGCLTAAEWYDFPKFQETMTAGPAAMIPYGGIAGFFFVDQNGVLKSYVRGEVSGWASAAFALPNNPPVGLTELGVGRVSATEFMICGKTSGNQYKCSPKLPLEGTWPNTPWTTLPGAYSSRPAVARWVSGIPRVFGRGAFDAQVWHTATLFGWEAPIPQGGDIAGSPSAVNWDNQTTHVFAKAGWNNSIWYTYQVGTSWGNWVPVD